MTLLIFAHPGEAQTFIKSDRLEKTAVPGLYQGQNYHLLITGGGGEKTLLAITRILTGGKVSEIINPGIAAALSPELPLLSLYSIRTCYAYREGKPVYDSFAMSPVPASSVSSARDCRRDCITVAAPVRHRQRGKLSGFADLADMELWWIAYAVKGLGLNIPIRAVKLISDTGNPSLPRIKENAQAYSDKLYDWYLSDSGKTRPEARPRENLPADFQSMTHFTVSQKKIFDSLFSRLNKAPQGGDFGEAIGWGEIRDMKITPKARAGMVVEKLREMLSPASYHLHRRLQHRLNELTAINDKIEINHDPLLESTELNCSFRADTSEEWNKRVEELQKVPAEKIFSLLNGEGDDQGDRRGAVIEEKVEEKGGVKSESDV